MTKGELGDRPADAPLDALGAKREPRPHLRPRATRLAPYASPTAMRTTEIGAWTPPIGSYAGDAPAGADDHVAADLLAQDPVRAADVVGLSGVIVAAFSPSPASTMARAASWTTALPVARRDSSDRSKRGN